MLPCLCLDSPRELGIKFSSGRGVSGEGVEISQIISKRHPKPHTMLWTREAIAGAIVQARRLNYAGRV